MKKAKNTWYYYIRDKKNRPVITVCLLKGFSHIYNHSGVCFSRGITICSNRDNPCKKTGRNRAYGRAKKAMFYKMSSDDIHRFNISDLLQLMQDNDLEVSHKATFAPSLNKFEYKLIQQEQ